MIFITNYTLYVNIQIKRFLAGHFIGPVNIFEFNPNFICTWRLKMLMVSNLNGSYLREVYKMQPEKKKLSIVLITFYSIIMKQPIHFLFNTRRFAVTVSYIESTVIIKLYFWANNISFFNVGILFFAHQYKGIF